MQTFDINNFVNEVTTKAYEDTENFIFETVRSFCEEKTQIIISKQELISALSLWKKLYADNATNGDMIKALFPDFTYRFTETDEYTNKPKVVVVMLGDLQHRISAEWWNAPYKDVEDAPTIHKATEVDHE